MINYFQTLYLRAKQGKVMNKKIVTVAYGLTVPLLFTACVHTHTLCFTRQNQSSNE